MALFSNLKECTDLRQYNLMYGVTDFSELEQFNMYESGYSFLKVIQIPKFLESIAILNASYNKLIYNFVHIVEHEFKGLDGLDNLTSDTLEISDGISNINVIGKVTEQSAASVSMRFQEKKGSPITRFIRFYLTGIRDPKTQVKTYHGLLDFNDANLTGTQVSKIGISTAGFENEVFTFLYFVTDPTMRELEAAYLLLAAQPTEAEENIYNGEKGTIEFKEVTVSVNCFPVRNNQVDLAAKNILSWMTNTQNAVRFVKNSSNYRYAKISEIYDDKTKGYSTYDAQYLYNSNNAQSAGDKGAKYDVNKKDNQEETLQTDFAGNNAIHQ